MAASMRRALTLTVVSKIKTIQALQLVLVRGDWGGVGQREDT